MNRAVYFVVACLGAVAPALGADDARVSFLEQEVRNLQRQVQSLSRRVDQLDSRPDRIDGRASPAPRAPSVATDPEWVDAAKWQRLRPGMSELEVFAVLGPPTSMRTDNGARVLFYALEVGASGFLGGSVLIRDQRVEEVRTPRLQ